MQLAERSPEELIRLDHDAAILRLQKQIVEAARERPYYTFRNLVFLCWRRSGKFTFDKLDNLQLQAVLDDVVEGAQVPYYTENMKHQICNCFGKVYHMKKCAVFRFLEAIEE